MHCARPLGDQVRGWLRWRACLPARSSAPSQTALTERVVRRLLAAHHNSATRAHPSLRALSWQTARGEIGGDRERTASYCRGLVDPSRER